MTKRLGKVHASYGMAETFWDIGFTPLQLAHADAEDEFKCTISVHVDAETGRVTLNNGYAPGTETYEQEERLFAEFRDAIVEALVAAIDDADPDYAAFFAWAKGDAARRAEALEQLDVDLAETEEDGDLMAA